jgi:hypothetical protein
MTNRYPTVQKVLADTEREMPDWTPSEQKLFKALDMEMEYNLRYHPHAVGPRATAYVCMTPERRDDVDAVMKIIEGAGFRKESSAEDLPNSPKGRYKNPDGGSCYVDILVYSKNYNFDEYEVKKGIKPEVAYIMVYLDRPTRTRQVEERY